MKENRSPYKSASRQTRDGNENVVMMIMQQRNIVRKTIKVAKKEEMGTRENGEFGSANFLLLPALRA